jgi:serine/threonine protein kinase
MESWLSRRILGYDVVRVLGEGGMGVVYELYDRNLDVRLAMKVLKPEFVRHPQIAPRFRQEAMLAARVKQPPLFKEPHRHVVRVLAADELADGSLYILMDYMEGVDLEDFVTQKDRGPLDVSTAVSIIIQICNVLSAAHGLKIAHRDLKGQNVFITSSPELDQHVKLLDFGLANLKESVRLPTASTKVVTLPGQVMGTLAFMAPEQMAGAVDVDGRADIFALGVLIYRMFTRRFPYPAEAFLELARQKESMPAVPLRSLRPDLDPLWDEILGRCLCADPAGRYPNTRMLAVAAARTTSDGASLFAAAWPRFAADADDFTVKNDGTIPERRPAALPIPTAYDSSLGSMSNAAGAIDVQRRSSLLPGGGRLALIGALAAALAAAVVGVVARGVLRDMDSAVASDEAPLAATPPTGAPLHVAPPPIAEATPIHVAPPPIEEATQGDAAPLPDAGTALVDAAAGPQIYKAIPSSKRRVHRRRVDDPRRPGEQSSFDPNGVLGM